jgi:hypothetical protein
VSGERKPGRHPSFKSQGGLRLVKLFLAAMFASMAMLAYQGFTASLRAVQYLLLMAFFGGLSVSFLISFLKELGKGRKGKQLN